VIQLKPDDVYIQYNGNLPYVAGYSPFVNLAVVKKYFGLFSIYVRLKSGNGTYLDISDYDAIPPDQYILEVPSNYLLQSTFVPENYKDMTVHQHLRDLKGQLEDVFDKLLNDGITNLPL